MDNATQSLIHYLSSSTVKQRIGLDELAQGTNMDRSTLDDVLLDALANGVIRGKLDLMTDTLAIMDFEARTPTREELPSLIDGLEAFKQNLVREHERLEHAMQADPTPNADGLATPTDYVDKQFVDMIHHCQPRPDPFLELFAKVSESETGADRGFSADRGEDKTVVGKMTRKAKELGRGLREKFMGTEMN